MTAAERFKERVANAHRATYRQLLDALEAISALEESLEKAQARITELEAEETTMTGLPTNEP